jgi:O-antigen/teichoic acid export membrane protein
MGIIIRQSIKGSIWSYLGVGLGFLTTGYLFPNYLTTDTIGLLGLLISWSILLAQFFSLGFNGITSRLFPYFRDKEKCHNGFLFIAFMVMITGFLMFLAVYFIFSPWLAENNADKSQMFSEYIYLLIPLTFFTMLYALLDIFNKLLYDAVFGTFLIEFFQRLLILISVLLFVFDWITLHHLVLAYAGAVSAKGAVMFFYLLLKGEICVKPRLDFVDARLRKEMISVAFFSILTGIGSNLIFSVDKIIINQMLGLSATGIYTIASFFGALVTMPSRPLQRISGTLIAEAWKRNDVSYISDIYKRSCMNQFIIGIFLFGGIWVNIDSILIILGPEYEAGKWVIFLIGIGTLTKMATGANALIVGYSKYYRMSLWFLLIQIVIFLVSIYLFVPLWGITGAAAAIMLSVFAGNAISSVFLYKKYKMQPYSSQYLFVLFIFIAAFAAGYVIPLLPLVWDILARGSAFAIVFLVIIVSTGISPDINSTIQKIMIQIRMSIDKLIR